MNGTTFERWLPVNFQFTPTTASVRWLNFGLTTLAEPFFNHTVKHLKRMVPPAAERVTTLTELLESGESVPKIQPAGVIFHVSRCGSTLLANILKAGTNCAVLGEAHPLGVLFQPRLFDVSPFQDHNAEEIRGLLLDCVVRLYGAAFGSRLVIKCHAASILQIARIRSIWPTVPFIIVIRDPIEVMVSNLAKPSGWLRSIYRRPDHQNIFGLTGTQIQQMTLEEYCARGLGRFFQAALDHMDKQCWILDYAKLTVPNIVSISRLLDIEIPDPESPQFCQVFLSYSKDRSGSKAFEDDRNRKQREAPPSVRSLARQWAQEPYERLYKGEAFPLNVF